MVKSDGANSSGGTGIYDKMIDQFRIIVMTYMERHSLDPLSRGALYMYSELDDDRWEKRKVCLYRDGTLELSSSKYDPGLTRLGDQPVLPVEDFAQRRGFEAREITAEEFEALWEKAQEFQKGRTTPLKT